MSVFITHEILSTKMPTLENKAKYIQTYSLWRDVWSSTFLELKDQRKIYSDDFLKCDTMSVLFSGGQAIGMVGYMFVDLSLKSYLDLAYFKTYPVSSLKTLKEQGHTQALIISYLTVREDWRKSRFSIPISELLIGIATKRFLTLPSTVMISFTRNDRGINDLVYRYGAVPLQKDCVEHNVKVDIVAFYRDQVRQSSIQGVAGYVEELWTKTGLAVNIETNFMPNIERVA